MLCLAAGLALLWLRKEQEIREFLGKEVSILTITKNGQKIPITLRQFREQILEKTEIMINMKLGGVIV